MTASTLKTTPLFQAHRALNAQMAPFGGWEMPIQYAGIIQEHQWTRSSVSVFDICHMGEFLLRADPRQTGLERALTCMVSDMPIGACRYGFMLNDSGGIIDDLVVYRLAQEEWMIVVNAATTEKDEMTLRARLAPSAQLRNVSAEFGKLDVQGPLSGAVLVETLGLDVAPLQYYTAMTALIGGERAIVSRTGYTGERGYELYLNVKKIPGLWETLLTDKRVRPAGLGARDTLRLEMGYPLYGQDIDEKTTPLEAGFERFIRFSKDFIGKEALVSLKKKGVGTQLVCLRTTSRRAPRHNYTISYEGEVVGTVTSGSFSPSLSCGIGMGYVPIRCARAGTALVLGCQGTSLEGIITEKPFYTQGSAKRGGVA